jgi:hypothetical protein
MEPYQNQGHGGLVRCRGWIRETSSTASLLRLEDLTENQIQHVKKSFAAAVPVDAIREPLETAQRGIAEVSEEIKEAKSRFSS